MRNASHRIWWRAPPIVDDFKQLTYRCCPPPLRGLAPFVTGLRSSADLKPLLNELGTGFAAAAFAAGEFGFGGDEAAFDGGFEDGGLLALEVCLDTLEASDGLVETGELLFDFGDDAVLFIEVDKRNFEVKQRIGVD